MAEDAAFLRSKTQVTRPHKPKKPESRLWLAVKRKYQEREDQLNADGLLRWDAVDSAVQEFVPLARNRRGLETHGTFKRYWRVVVEKQFDPGRFDDKHFRMPREHIQLQLKVYRDGSWKLGHITSANREPVRSRSADGIRDHLVKLLAHGRDVGH